MDACASESRLAPARQNQLNAEISGECQAVTRKGYSWWAWWLPFFNYDSGNDFASLTVTATIPAVYKLTTSVPQTEHVVGDLRTVHGESVHPQFILSLIYDTDWRSATTRIGDLRFETLLTPKFRFSHDSLAALVAREYRFLTPRFAEPQAPS